ncbi:MAG: nucleotidyl transferase AbiEii/AbiGii toxin family protein, partial [Bdellovibrionales bacterium]|nr:nucleotidyl transferase AbiEii/AbiGii toxin family protein [Bdellovibrionales bacterium]
GKNHDDEKHRISRKKYFDWVAIYLKEKIHGASDVMRDEIFDDIPKYRNGGVRILYPSIYPLPDGLKEGILLEVGFDNVSPNQPKTITSWAFEKAKSNSKISVKDNRARHVSCYEPQYTFVEKLQAIARKYRLFKEGKGTRAMPENFLRHYYDIYQLLDLPEVRAFIGTHTYESYKKERFKGDSTDLSRSEAFTLDNLAERSLFEKEYIRTSSLYYRGQPAFSDILTRIHDVLPTL